MPLNWVPAPPPVSGHRLAGAKKREDPDLVAVTFFLAAFAWPGGSGNCGQGVGRGQVYPDLVAVTFSLRRQSGDLTAGRFIHYFYGELF